MLGISKVRNLARVFMFISKHFLIVKLHAQLILQEYEKSLVKFNLKLAISDQNSSQLFLKVYFRGRSCWLFTKICYPLHSGSTVSPLLPTAVLGMTEILAREYEETRCVFPRQILKKRPPCLLSCIASKQDDDEVLGTD